MGDYKVERLWRDAKLLEIGGGTNEAHHKVMLPPPLPGSFPGPLYLAPSSLTKLPPSPVQRIPHITHAAVQNMVRDIKKGGGRIA